jgi:BNR repeat-like domain
LRVLVPCCALVTVAGVAQPAGSAAAGGPSASGLSGRYVVRDLRVLSGPTPFPAGCPGAAQDDAHIAGAEIEPAVTVDPRRPGTIVATWQQDLGYGGRSDLIATSSDGGRTWSRRTIPGLTRCTGGTADSASDPWLAAGGDGTIYFTGAAISLATDPPVGTNVSSRSRDGGRHWTRTTPISAASRRTERMVVTAEPRRPGHAYAAWFDRDPALPLPLDGTLLFARTTDSASSWSAPVIVDAAPPNGLDLSGQVLVLRDGSLLAVFARLEILEDGSYVNRLLTSRSPDLGRTWPAPRVVASEPIQPVTDPETGQGLSNQDMSYFSAATGPDGTLYVAWDRDTSAASGTVEFVSSADAGRTWTAPRAIPGISAFAFEPAIAVDANGTLGVLWYDNRRDRLGDDQATTDVWFAASSDRGRTWQHTHLAGSFDLRTAPHGRLGEYQGLAAIGRHGFAAVVTMSAPQAKDGPSDIFFARIVPVR